MGVQAACQRILHEGRELSDDQRLDTATSLEVSCLLDESPMFTWDITNNPDSAWLQGEGGMIRYVEPGFDYTHVHTQVPIQRGVHFFEFVMHHKYDEQWCGLATK